MMALGKSVGSGTGFLAGHFWKETAEVDTKQAAQNQGLGVLFENGDDLAVLYKGAS